MKLVLLATAVLLAAGQAYATQLIDFGQTSNTNTITATNNAGDTQTTISTTDTQVLVDQYLGGGAPFDALMDFTATSTDSVSTVSGSLLQHYSGTFCITSGPGCTGTDYLSGTFTDAAFGLATGDQLSVNVANPPDTLGLTSSVLTPSQLIAPNSFTLSMSNLGPPLSQIGTTIAAFTASYSGTADSSVAAVPEPASIALLGAGLLGLGFLRRYRV